MDNKTVWVGKRIWRAAKNSRIEIVFLVNFIGTVFHLSGQETCNYDVKHNYVTPGIKTPPPPPPSFQVSLSPLCALG